MLRTDYITCAIIRKGRDGRFQEKLLHYWARELTKFGNECAADASRQIPLDYAESS
jgi:hypothetical protein